MPFGPLQPVGHLIAQPCLDARAGLDVCGMLCRKQIGTARGDAVLFGFGRLSGSSDHMHDQRDDEQDQKNEEQDFGDCSGCTGNPAKTENTGDQSFN